MQLFNLQDKSRNLTPPHVDLLKGLQLAVGGVRIKSHPVCFLSNTHFY